MRPRTQFTKCGDITIAYQVTGEGPLDLIYIPGWVSNVEFEWENPKYAHFFQMLGSFSRLIRFDKRGTGMSDRDVGYPTLEMRMDDVRAVMEAVGSKKAAIFCMSESGFLGSLFAATYPELTTALIMMGCSARGTGTDDYPYKRTKEELEDWIQMLEDDWGGPIDLKDAAPDLAHDEWQSEWFSALVRYGASLQSAIKLTRYPMDVDVRDILPTIRVPALVIQRLGDRWAPLGNGRYLAQHIPNARLVELDDNNHLIWAGDTERIVSETRQFLTGLDANLPVERVLLTVMMTDISESTLKVAELGDKKWSQLVEQHHAITRDQIKNHGGTEIDVAGDGFLMTFDGPSQALNCATQIHKRMEEIGLKLRVAIHTGECERSSEGLKGIAVHIAARILEEAHAGVTFASSTVIDLVVGSGFVFD
jgi:pimeloyl-ACP methyl ester carboxylesterase